MRLVVFAVTLCFPAWVFAQSQPHSSPPASNSRNLLGARFAQVPELLQAHLPQLQNKQGLVVTNIADGSVAERIGLRRHDILILYKKQPVADVKQLASLLAFTQPDRPQRMLVFRKGKATTLSFSLQPNELPQYSAAKVKNTGPPGVQLEAELLKKGRLKVKLTCYAVGGKRQTFTSTGTPHEIEVEFRDMTRIQNVPSEIQDLVNVALKRLRANVAQK